MSTKYTAPHHVSILAALAGLVLALPIQANDLFTTDDTPGVVFDDTDNGGWEWVLRGREEFFALADEAHGYNAILVLPGQYTADAIVIDGQEDVHQFGDSKVVVYGDSTEIDEVRINEELIISHIDSDTETALGVIADNGNANIALYDLDTDKIWYMANFAGKFGVYRRDKNKKAFVLKGNGDAKFKGVVTQLSAKSSKQDIEPVDTGSVLDKIGQLEISEWSYKDAPQDRHMGPMAGDFYQTFGLGSTPRGISTLDSSGVALAGIQALMEENAALKERLATLEALVATKLEGQLAEPVRASVAMN